MKKEPQHKIVFAEFELDVGKRCLRRGGEDVRLNSKAFDLLVFLTGNTGRVLAKDEILNSVWNGQFVEEANLAVQISALRKILRDSKENPRFLFTVPGKGYEFVADIQTDEEIIIENHKFSRLVIEENNDKQNVYSSFLFNFSLSKILLVFLLLTTTTAAIWFWRSRMENPESKQLKFNRLTTTGRVSGLALTPDGRYAVFAQSEENGESLWLRQIETGSQTQITPPQKVNFLGLAVSPDGNFIYTPIYLENQSDTPLWKIPILGGVAQEIPNVETCGAVSFSPDGKKIAYIESPGPETHFVIADADGTNEQILIRAQNEKRIFSSWQSNSTAWSPDGKSVAVVYEEKGENGSQAGILLVNPTDGSEKIFVSPQWAYVDFAAWLDAETLVFTGFDDEWSNQIWKVSRQTGKAQQITQDLQKYSWLATRNGTLLTTQINAVSNLNIVDFVENAKILQPREIYRESGYALYVGWGKNGEIYYCSRVTGKREIWQIESNGTNPRQITSDANVIYGFAVSPTDNSFIFPSRRNGKLSLWMTDADGRNLQQISDGSTQIFPEMAEDGTIVFQENNYQISRLTVGQQTPVQVSKGVKPSLSPDGKQIAFFLMDQNKWRIRIVATNSGEVLENLDLPTNVIERRIRWHPSGKFLTLIYNSGENLSLLLLPTDGGEGRIIENLGKGEINTFDWSADGKQLLYSLTNKTKDAVILSGF